jgi:hypothetical protein
MRWALFLVACALTAAEYDAPAGTTRLYTWSLRQSTAWQSADDHLRFDTEITWKLGLRSLGRDGAQPQQQRLNATIITVAATHRGPGADSRVASVDGTGADDPLLGHLLALAGHTLELWVEPATGTVTRVGGTEAIIAALAERAPAAVPGDPPPLDAANRAAFAPEALARIWSQALALPGPSATVALPPPFAADAAYARTWSGQAWTANLPKPVAFVVASDPAPVRGTLTALDGSGTNVLAGGMPRQIQGNLTFTIDYVALTQPVSVQQAVEWRLEELER